MDVIDILTIIGYTITVFSFGYALGKDCCKKTVTTAQSLANFDGRCFS